jgi:hypothetical protein
MITTPELGYENPFRILMDVAVAVSAVAKKEVCTPNEPIG